ncbi:hypothetical protein CHU_2820 [Cytophaga hutchinsonii ATCC 33406]|uniref:Uncharacterized protein n=2 Tax=Cytophaga hutchinsonii TaxID=985 RepID=A0A6N4SUB6_CYTH3|nr:hypothetical protein CHU_2820 [Cytophaga hutchinsonii ATCC 33406]
MHPLTKLIHPMLTPSEYKNLYALMDTYLGSDACKSAFAKNNQAEIDYSTIVICVDDLICENFDYSNPNKIKDKVNVLNGKNDFNKTLIAFKNQKNEMVFSIKYFDLPK